MLSSYAVSNFINLSSRVFLWKSKITWSIEHNGATKNIWDKWQLISTYFRMKNVRCKSSLILSIIFHLSGSCKPEQYFNQLLHHRNRSRAHSELLFVQVSSFPSCSWLRHNEQNTILDQDAKFFVKAHRQVALSCQKCLNEPPKPTMEGQNQLLQVVLTPHLHSGNMCLYTHT